MSVKQGGNTIAGGTSNMVTTDTAQTISGQKTFGSLIRCDENILIQSSVAKGSTPTSDEWHRFTISDSTGSDSDSGRLATFEGTIFSNGNIRASMRAYQNEANSSANSSIYIQRAMDGTITTSAPACTNTNSIVTTTSRSVASQNVVFGFGNGFKIAAKHVSLTGGTEATWNYGITFSASPTVTICQKSGASTTSGATMWVRGAPGTSSCKVYSGSSTSAMLIVVGY